MTRQTGKLEIELLGRCNIRVNGLPPERTISQGACGILTLLILHRKRSLTREGISQTLWDQTQVANPDANFRQALRVLRQVLGAEAESRLLEDREGPLKYLRLDLRGAEVDVVRFEESCRRAQQTGALADWEEAMQFYGGPLLPGYEASWVLPLRADLQNAWLEALDRGAEAALKENVLDRAQTMLYALLQTDPCQERAAQRLMTLLGEQRRYQEAFEVFYALRRSLQDYGRGLPAPEIASLYERLQRLHASPTTSPARPKPKAETPAPRLRKLPAPVNALIGRANELSRLGRMLAISRCVTLIGAGGVGKTRLALEIGWQEETGFRDGVAFVDFSRLLPGVPDIQVCRLIAETLEIRETSGASLQERLVQEIGDRHLLLIFDNCEHILKVVTPLVERLLSACPALHLLATSREPLQARGERSFRTPSLAYPIHEVPYSPRDLMRYNAAQLFLERIALSDFTLTDSEVPAITWLCRTLDGIPLALELAASQLDYFGTIENLNAQIRRSFWFLKEMGRDDVPERYLVLRETIAWSYDLLTPAEKALLRALATLWGGGTEEAIVAIAPSPASSGLAWSLQRKSLLSRVAAVPEASPESPPRYRLTEPIRQFAQEKLVEAQEEEEAQRRHTDFFLTYVELAEPQLNGADQQMWLRRLEADQENWRAAMQGALRRSEKEKALRFGIALWRFWALRGRHLEGDAFLREALALPGEASPHSLARAWQSGGNLAYLCGDLAYTRRCFLTCRQLAQEREDTSIEASALAGLAAVEIVERNYAEAGELLQKAAESFEAAQHRHGLGAVYGNLANVATFQKDYKTAAGYHRKGIALWREIGARHSLALELNNLCNTLMQESLSPELPGILLEALEISLEIGSPRHFVHTLFNTLAIAMRCRRYAQATLLLSANGIYRKTHHQAMPPPAMVIEREYREQARAELGQEQYDRLWAQGERASEEEITALIREILASPFPSAPAS